MKSKFFILIFIFLQNVIIYSQVIGTNYYGRGGLGHIEFISDSICTVSFVGDLPSYPLIDTAYYYRNGDTILISTKIKDRYEIRTYDTQPKFNCNDYAIIQDFSKMKSKKNAITSNEIISFDTTTNELYFGQYDYEFYSSWHSILYYKGYHRLCMYSCYISSKYYNIVKLMELETDQTIFLNEFPLIIKRNKLKPLSSKEIECMKFRSDNGFNFPVMKKSKGLKNYKTLYIKDIAFEGIPTSICMPESTMIMTGEKDNFKIRKFKIKPKYNPD